MSRDRSKGSVTYDVEASWGEDVDVTADWRLPLLDAVDVSGLTWAKLDPARVVQRRNECTRYIPGPKGGSFRTKLYLTGRGTTADNVVSNLGILLGYVFGNAAMNRSADMTAGNDWDTDDGTVSGSGGTTAGSVFVFGAKGDGGGDGQPSVVELHSLTQLDLLFALPAAPANGSAIYATEMIYPSETASDAAQDVTGLRFNLKTANLQYLCHGCFARSVTITGTNPNELLSIEIEWGVSWWEEIAATFPDTTATDIFTPLPNACGSFFLQIRGTKTRSTRNYRTLSLTIDLGIAEQVGPGGVNAYQSIVGAKRVPDNVTLEWTEDSEAATTGPALAALFDADASYHGCIEWTNADNKRTGIYFPSLEFIGERPSQVDGDGINRIRATMKAGTGPTVTTELEASAYRFYQQ